MDTETKVLAYVAGGMLSVGSAVGLGYVLGGPVGACTVAGAVGGILLWLGTRSGLRTPPTASSPGENRPYLEELGRRSVEVNDPPKNRTTFEIRENETALEALKRLLQGR